MATKIIDTPNRDIHPRHAYRRASDNALVIIYWHYPNSGAAFDLREAVSTDEGVTWVTALINSATTTFDISGGSGITDAGTELAFTSSYNIPIETPPHNPAKCWRKPSGGSWARGGDLPQPVGLDDTFVPFGRPIDLGGGTVRQTCHGREFGPPKTGYAHVYYVDTTDEV